MVANNLVAIPSYVLYLIVLQPLRILDSKSFWYIEGVLFKLLLAMVASWGWWAGYTGKNVLLMSIMSNLKRTNTLKDCFLVGMYLNVVDTQNVFL